MIIKSDFVEIDFINKLEEILLEKYKQQDPYCQVEYRNVIETVKDEIANILTELTED